MSSIKSGEIKSLTGMRGLAAWWVVFFHFVESAAAFIPDWLQRLFSKGYLAVDLFFILSGFVIFISYRDGFGKLTCRGYFYFLAKRLARIYPLHLLLLVLFISVPVAIHYFSTAKDLHGRFELSYFIQSLFLVQNWGFSDGLDWNIPAWSISTELGAYLLFPFMCWLINRSLFRGEILVVSLMLITFLALALIFHTAQAGSIGGKIPELGLLRCVLEFFSGVGLGRLFVSRSRILYEGRWLHGLLAVLLIGTGISCGWPDYFFMPVAFMFVIAFLISTDTFVSEWLASPFIYFVGQISYSTYLCHDLIRDWIKFLSRSMGHQQMLAYVVLVMIASIVLYFLVEEPSRRCLNKIIKRREGAKIDR